MAHDGYLYRNAGSPFLTSRGLGATVGEEERYKKIVFDHAVVNRMLVERPAFVTQVGDVRQYFANSLNVYVGPGTNLTASDLLCLSRETLWPKSLLAPAESRNSSSPLLFGGFL